MGVAAGTLETPRLRLYALTEEQLLHAMHGLPGVIRMLGAELTGRGYGLLEMAFKRRIYRAKLSLIRQTPDALLLSTMWFMVLKESGEMVGEIGFKGPPRGGEVELGYSTRPSMRARGYMTEAVGEMCRFAFSQNRFAVSRVCALTSADNAASHGVLEKNGFVRDGSRGRYWYWRKDRAL